jgi:C4-dicarboxylate-specific signal transduction histidine kinase/ABC-type uncharacterized transport system substrate-binding protein
VLALLFFACGLSTSAAAADGFDNVLVIYSQNRLLPANIEVDRGLHEDPNAQMEGRVQFFSEFLDAPVFGGNAYEARTAAYLKEKYSAQPPSVIVVGGEEALTVVLRHRAVLFPDVPIVHVGVSRKVLNSIDLPPDVVGVPADYDIAGTLELALQLHPRARRVVVVTGASNWGKQQLEDLRAMIETHRLALPVEYLSGLPTDRLTSRLAALTPDTVVLTPGYFIDGDGRKFTPRSSVSTMAASSAAPVYVFFASQIGSGAVGGRMSSYVDMGRAARGIIDSILAGTPASSTVIPARMATPAQLDARQLRRWKVAPELIPEDAIIHFQEASFWERYRWQAMVVGAVLLVQAGLILALLFERVQRRRTAAALDASERNNNLAAQAARLSMFVWNLVPARTQANGKPGGHEVAPGPPQEDFDRVLETVHPADRNRLELAVRKAVADGGELDVEFRMLRPDGQVRWMAARGHTANGPNGSLAGVRMDITSRRTAELQAEADRATLTHMARIATMGQLSAAIGHQLNQPLAAILGNAETARKLLGRADPPLDEVREILDDVIVEDNRAADVIRRLGALYRRGDAEATAVDLNELVRETLDMLHAELVNRHVTPVLELAEALPAVPGNRVQLQQVVLNLALNAADAMADVDMERRVLTLRTSLEGGHVHLCVIDRGEGIPAGDLKNVFEPFWTTKATGIGVGLAICKTIVAAHRGTLTASNDPDGGAVFCLRLPVQRLG